MNMKFTIPPQLAKYLQTIKRSKSAIVGLLLIALFAYTAYVVNAATNVKSDGTSSTPSNKIVFDKAVLKAVTDRNQVPDQTTLGSLGKPDPFAR